MATTTRAIVGDVLKIRNCYTQGNQIAYCVYHMYAYGSSGLGARLDVIAKYFADNVGEAWRQLAVAAAAEFGCGAQRVWPTLSDEGIFLCSASKVGVQSGDTLPFQCAALLSKRTARAGRHGHGRMYLPFLSEASTNALGQLDTAFVTNLQTMADAFLVPDQNIPDGGDVTAVSPVLWDRVAHVTTRIASVIVRKNIFTQRRRSEGYRADSAPLGIV